MTTMMGDPHVVELRYRVKTGEGVSYNNPPPVTVKETFFEMTLADNLLTVMMVEHHPTVESARSRVRDYLRAWELQTELDVGPGHLEFEFDSAKVVDRNPPPPGTVLVGLSAVASAAGVSYSIGVWRVERTKYPDTPSRFVASTLVEHLWNRYVRYLDGKDLLTTMGYYCLSTITNEAGGRAKAVIRYKIDRDVLDKLGTLTSDVGDETTARKVDEQSTKRAHTPAETAWIQAAAKKIIRRVGELEANPAASLASIMMADLPAL
jgi:hypothetical protein